MAMVKSMIAQADTEDDAGGYPAILPQPLAGPHYIVPHDPDICASDDEPAAVVVHEPAEPDALPEPPPGPEPIADNIGSDDDAAPLADVIPIPADDEWPAMLEGMELKKTSGRRRDGGPVLNLSLIHI